MKVACSGTCRNPVRSGYGRPSGRPSVAAPVAQARPDLRPRRHCQPPDPSAPQSGAWRLTLACPSRATKGARAVGPRGTTRGGHRRHDPSTSNRARSTRMVARQRHPGGQRPPHHEAAKRPPFALKQAHVARRCPCGLCSAATARSRTSHAHAARVCNAVCTSTGHTGARPGTTWHNRRLLRRHKLARVAQMGASWRCVAHRGTGAEESSSPAGPTTSHAASGSGPERPPSACTGPWKSARVRHDEHVIRRDAMQFDVDDRRAMRHDPLEQLLRWQLVAHR